MGATFTVTVEWERESGKFASREEIVNSIQEWLEQANEDQVDGIGSDGDSTYNIIDWEVSEQVTSKKP